MTLLAHNYASTALLSRNHNLATSWTSSRLPGILGREIVKQLVQSPAKWTTIYALSRRKTDDSAEQMGRDLAGVEAEYIFFAAYLQKKTDQENWDINGEMLQNFLTALPSPSKTHRMLLVNGSKQYGIHLGQPKNPMIETDPWLTSPAFPPNFYYRQQTILTSFCATHPPTSWTVTYPNDVIGFASGNFMNLASGLALYAVVCKELGHEELKFPGCEAFYNTMFESFTSAPLHARFCEWAVTEPRCARQAFNVADGDVQSWQDLWPRLAARFGMRVAPEQFEGTTGLEETVVLGTPPMSVFEETAGLKGRVKPSIMEWRVRLVKWSQLEEVKKAWERLAEREGLQRDAFEKATWDFTDYVLGRKYNAMLSVSKAREAGWTGYQDSWKSLSDVFGEMEAAGVLSKTHRG
ncbi:Iridoid synthase [Staphylotrichum tortipilum]|uniref:Iridoid synthase n=1 Tax=Staphylotrichum tortipilum TaxID=2831512 RepID=A0AAN6MFT6_9PEZI|nr:Iridoid synthase [Staphylotrichum longicolle]